MRDPKFWEKADNQPARIRAGQDLTGEVVPDLSMFSTEFLNDLIREASLTLSRRKGAASDQRPHSRACGFRKHEHGPDCSYNCPTCHGKNEDGSLSPDPLPLHPMPFVWPSGQRSIFSHGDGIELAWAPPEGYEQDRTKYPLVTVGE